MQKIHFICLLFAAFLLSECKKEKAANSDINLVGSWQQATKDKKTPSYLIFKSNKTLDVLNTDDRNLRYIQQGYYSTSGGQLLLSLNGTEQIMNLSQSGDSLFLTSTDPSRNLVLLKDNLAPKTTESYISPVAILDRFEDTAKVVHLTYYANKLYGIIDFPSTLFTYDLSLKKITAATTLSTSYSGITALSDGSLWTVYGNTLLKINFSGTVLFTSAANPGSYGHGLTYDGEYLYTVLSDRLSGYNINSNAFEDNIYMSYDITEIAAAKGHIYAVKNGAISKIEKTTDRAIQSFFVKDYYIRTITFDGTYFWASASDNKSDKIEILKLDLN
jgi:hypothetical protein